MTILPGRLSMPRVPSPIRHSLRKCNLLDARVIHLWSMPLSPPVQRITPPVCFLLAAAASGTVPLVLSFTGWRSSWATAAREVRSSSLELKRSGGGDDDTGGGGGPLTLTLVRATVPQPRTNKGLCICS